MVTDRVSVPEIGEAIEEGTLSSWLVDSGQSVTAGQPLFELSTDKVDSEIPSPFTGTVLELLVPEGSNVRIGDDVAVISHDEETVVPVDAPTTAVDPSPVAEPVPPSPPPPGGQSSAVHDLSPAATLAPLPPLPGHTAARNLGALDPNVGALDPAVEPFTRIRAATAKAMVRSSSEIPHVASAVEIDYSAIFAARKAWSHGRAPTPLSFICAAVGRTLLEFPHLNSSVKDDGLLIHDVVHIAIAVDTPDGLLAPVIRNVASLSVDGIGSTIRDLAARARAGDIVPGDLSGATFTISNNGSAGSVFTTPLITPPQVAVISTDQVQDRVVVVETEGTKGIAIRPIGTLVMSWDHRAVDGAEAARFLVAVKNRAESDLVGGS